MLVEELLVPGVELPLIRLVQRQMGQERPLRAVPGLHRKIRPDQWVWVQIYMIGNAAAGESELYRRFLAQARLAWGDSRGEIRRALIQQLPKALQQAAPEGWAFGRGRSPLSTPQPEVLQSTTAGSGWPSWSLFEEGPNGAPVLSLCCLSEASEPHDSPRVLDMQVPCLPRQCTYSRTVEVSIVRTPEEGRMERPGRFLFYMTLADDWSLVALRRRLLDFFPGVLAREAQTGYAFMREGVKISDERGCAGGSVLSVLEPVEARSCLCLLALETPREHEETTPLSEGSDAEEEDRLFLTVQEHDERGARARHAPAEVLPHQVVVVQVHAIYATAAGEQEDTTRFLAHAHIAWGDERLKIERALKQQIPEVLQRAAPAGWKLESGITRCPPTVEVASDYSWPASTLIEKGPDGCPRLVIRCRRGASQVRNQPPLASPAPGPGGSPTGTNPAPSQAGAPPAVPPAGVPPTAADPMAGDPHATQTLASSGLLGEQPPAVSTAAALVPEVDAVKPWQESDGRVCSQQAQPALVMPTAVAAVITVGVFLISATRPPLEASPPPPGVPLGASVVLHHGEDFGIDIIDLRGEWTLHRLRQEIGVQLRHNGDLNQIAWQFCERRTPIPPHLESADHRRASQVIYILPPDGLHYRPRFRIDLMEAGTFLIEPKQLAFTLLTPSSSPRPSPPSSPQPQDGKAGGDWR